MAQYEKKVLNALLDSYENSVLFTKENKVNISIQFPFNKKTIPAYFDESSPEYENIHIAMRGLAGRGFIELVWKRGAREHILSKVTLNMAKLEEIYHFVNRVPKSEMLGQNIKVLKELKIVYNTPVCSGFITHLLSRMENCQSVKEFVAIENIEETKSLLKGIFAVEKNEIPCYIREFSIRTFQDSKIFEQMKSRIIKILKEFGEEFFGRDGDEILAEYGIYHTPNYVYLKGDLTVYIKNNCFPVNVLKQGIGISGEDIADIRFDNIEGIQCVITIENLTTFFRWNQHNSLLIYLGGYHNGVRRTLLKTVYQCLPEVTYYHFGDIDAGGFEIYRDLCEKTGIPFEMYKMDLKTLKKYKRYGKELKKNDRIRLEKIRKRMLEQEEESSRIWQKEINEKCEDKRDREFVELIQYMLENNVKLEQECIGLAEKGRE